MSSCTRIQDLIDQQDRPSEHLPESALGHLRTCHPCNRTWRRHQDYWALVEQAREISRQAPDLSPGAWARMKGNVQHRDQRFLLKWVLLPSLGAAMAAMLLWVGLAPPSITGDTVGLDLWPTGAAAPDLLVDSGGPSPDTFRLAPPSTVGTSSYQTLSRADASTLGAGSHLVGGERGLQLVAFQRHGLVLGPRARATLVAWSPARIVVRVHTGVVRAVVRRERPKDVF